MKKGRDYRWHYPDSVVFHRSALTTNFGFLHVCVSLSIERHGISTGGHALTTVHALNLLCNETQKVVLLLKILQCGKRGVIVSNELGSALKNS
ncbi:hypothetical protein DPMN_026431 [Dreissena polymorpha]|uniref:Uncharacterized protein n=1 Tax=Dreissena polymorpha TaxID=45954 RepID=A0A9D4LTE2_DREPO|nr:hypothetical protein DPMN_026431 [Dreissena polymorpha]